MIENILKERQTTHGSFENSSKVSQTIKAALRVGQNYTALDSMQREALDMITHKMARIVSGNPDFIDHWTDLIGYAELVRKEL